MRVLGRYRVAGHDTTSGDSRDSAGVFQFVRKLFVLTEKASPDPSKSPFGESGVEQHSFTCADMLLSADTPSGDSVGVFPKACFGATLLHFC